MMTLMIIMMIMCNSKHNRMDYFLVIDTYDY
jgi:hypothetical protein